MFKSEGNMFKPCPGKTLSFQINYHDTVIINFNWFMKKVLKKYSFLEWVTSITVKRNRVNYCERALIYRAFIAVFLYVITNFSTIFLPNVKILQLF